MRAELDGTLQKAEATIAQQASYIGKDFLQRLYAKVQQDVTFMLTSPCLVKTRNGDAVMGNAGYGQLCYAIALIVNISSANTKALPHRILQKILLKC